jgi:hypothetical protein
MSIWSDNMEHDFITHNLQFAWEAFKAFGPVAIFAALTYWITNWGEK